jgi:hypothetical protein
MADPKEERCNSRRTSRLCGAIVVLLCLCIAVAVLHANSLPRCPDTLPMNVEGDVSRGWWTGWPVIHGYGESPVGWPPMSWPQELKDIDARWLLADLFMAGVLVVSPIMILRLRRARNVRPSQFTLSDLFALTTAVAMLSAIFSLERALKCSDWGDHLGVYAGISVCPWYDQVAISIGILCALYLVITALSQMVRATVTRPRRRPKG